MAARALTTHWFESAALTALLPRLIVHLPTAPD